MGLPWEKFNKFRGAENFFGAVDEKGVWFDSAQSFEIAVHWVCMAAGKQDLTTEEELGFMQFSKCSVIHSDMLKKMYEAGLLS